MARSSVLVVTALCGGRLAEGIQANGIQANGIQPRQRHGQQMPMQREEHQRQRPHRDSQDGERPELRRLREPSATFTARKIHAETPMAVEMDERRLEGLSLSMPSDGDTSHIDKTPWGAKADLVAPLGQAEVEWIDSVTPTRAPVTPAPTPRPTRAPLSPDPTQPPTTPPPTRPPFSRPPTTPPTVEPTSKPTGQPVMPLKQNSFTGSPTDKPSSAWPTYSPTIETEYPTDYPTTSWPTYSPSSEETSKPTSKPTPGLGQNAMNLGKPNNSKPKPNDSKPNGKPGNNKPGNKPSNKPGNNDSKPKPGGSKPAIANSEPSPGNNSQPNPTRKPSRFVKPTGEFLQAETAEITETETPETGTPEPSKSPSREPSVAESASKKPSRFRFPTPLPTPSPEATKKPSRFKFPTPLPTPASPSKQPTASPTKGPSPSPSKGPSPAPTPEPSSSPSKGPSPSPSMGPSKGPTSSPSKSPSQSPSMGPSQSPTPSPSASPSTSPSSSPTTSQPTRAPSSGPSSSPSKAPSHSPVAEPSSGPSVSSMPQGTPSVHPSVSDWPSAAPSESPSTKSPTSSPSKGPSQSPSMGPSAAPSKGPSLAPTTLEPSKAPSKSPSPAPKKEPTPPPTVLAENELPEETMFDLVGSISMSMSMSMDLTIPEVVTPSPTQAPVTSSPSKPSRTSEPTGSPSGSPTTSEPTQSPSGSPHTTAAPTSSAFSTEVGVTFDGVSEEMDESDTAVLEEVTKSFLDEQFAGSMEVSEVKVLSQSIVASRKGLRRTLQSSSLFVELGIEGTVTDWQAVESSVATSDGGEDLEGSIGDSIGPIIEESISTNFEELSDDLAEQSDFFPSISSSKAVVVDPVQGESNNPNQLIFIIAGVAVALVVLVGSMFYMERRSGNKRRRELDDVDGEGPAYDLNSMDYSQEKDDNAEGDGASEVEGIILPCSPCPSQHNEPAARNLETKSPKRSKVSEARMTSLMDKNSSLTEEDQPERSALEMSPEALKAAIKKKEGNIFVFTDDKARRQSTASASGSNVNEDDLEIKHSVSSLSNPSQIEELPTPVSQGGYLSGHFNYADAEKMIGDQYDTRAIMTPFTPKGSGNGTPSGRRSNYSFSSPVSVTRGRSSRKDKLFDVYAPPGPLGIIIDTTPEGPMIHSLKPTSQLLGLVSPGDLIVGLDGVDTRNMTAATFTRLMAKRSQGERKITLLKGLAPLTPTAGTPR